MSFVTMDDGVRINVKADAASDRPALLLSNSLGTNLHMWDAQMPAFGKRFRIIRYDSRGHGKSDAPKGPYTMERLGRDAVAVLDALKIDRTYYCGLSKGGMVGQWLGVNAASRLIRLALCDTAAKMASPVMFRERAEVVRRSGMATILDAVVERWFTPQFRQGNASEVQRISAMVLATPPEGYAACCEAIATMDQLDSIRAITTPTLVLVGSEDPATTPAQARDIHERIAGSRYIEIPEAAHLSNIERTDAFNRAVLDFLAG